MLVFGNGLYLIVTLHQLIDRVLNNEENAAGAQHEKESDERPAERVFPFCVVGGFLSAGEHHLEADIGDGENDDRHQDEGSAICHADDEVADTAVVYRITKDCIGWAPAIRMRDSGGERSEEREYNSVQHINSV